MARNAAGKYKPWVIAGGPDPDFADADRAMHHAALTDPHLLERFRQRFPADLDPDPDYDVIVRRLRHVWDCPRDEAANVTGFCCAVCGCTRSEAGQLPPFVAAPEALERASGGSAKLTYVRRLCEAFAEQGVDALVELVPHDVEWIPQIAGGRVLRGSGQLRAFIAERAGSPVVSRPTAIHAVGEHVLVRFEAPAAASEPLVLWSLYQFQHGRLARAISFDREADALRAAA
jgi:hypothetical protein